MGPSRDSKMPACVVGCLGSHQARLVLIPVMLLLP